MRNPIEHARDWEQGIHARSHALDVHRQLDPMTRSPTDEILEVPSRSRARLMAVLRLLGPRLVLLRVIAFAFRQPPMRRQLKFLAARFPALERRIKARLFSHAAAAEHLGKGLEVPSEPLCGKAQWLHAYLRSRQAKTL